jgi:lactoylglutathione lyase
MNNALGFDHLHLISRDPKASAQWYVDMFGGEITEVQENLRGAPQIDVRVGGMTLC